MPRISKADHPGILAMVDRDGRKVAEVAATYGCTAANIYALLGKLRRGAPSGPDLAASDAAATTAPTATPGEEFVRPGTGQDAARGSDLFGAILDVNDAPATAEDLGKGHYRAPDAIRAVPAPATPKVPVAASAMGRAEVVALPALGSSRKAGAVGAAAAKPGMALVMRTGEGEESLSPFRSLDDLLSAIKPILRAAARSSDAVWFSIQPVDLATIESDAA